MTLGKLTLFCWLWFGLMSFAFLPLCLLASQVPGPSGVRVALYVLIIGVLWWGSFAYGMYLSIAGMGGGDKRLLKRGIRGTARVLVVKGTNTYINGASDLGYAGRRVYRYTLKVELPGRQPYETYVSVASHQLQQGQTVQVAAGRHNHMRVAIDLAASAEQVVQERRAVQQRLAELQRQAAARRRAERKQHATAQDARPPRDSVPRDSVPRQAVGGDEGERLRQLSELGRLHREGVLSDEEFAAEKTRILGFGS